MFEQDWKTLNKMQKQVVENIKEPLLVLAPAGTGKTKVIAMRTAHLLNQGIDPGKILCLTFTNKAAREMETRIGLYHKGAVRALTIKTFHSFCYTIINHEKEHSRLAFPCSIIDESDAEDIIRRILFALTGQEEKYIGHIISFIENLKKYRLQLEPEDRVKDELVVKSYLKENKVREHVLCQYGLALLKHYEKYLRDNNCVDFTDLIVEASYLFENEQIVKKWQQRYQYIQVDEMQDTSTREYAIIKKLAIPNQVALYGDYNQTIYEWRGSNPVQMIDDYKTTFHPTEMMLETNYRSTQLLLKAANDYIRNSNLYPTISTPEASEVGEPIEVMIASNKNAEYMALAKSIETHLKHSEKRIAVLTRTNGMAKEIYQLFNQRGIPCIKVDDIRLLRKKEVKDFLAFISYSVNLRNSYALEKIIKHPALHMEEWLIKELKKTKSAYMALHDWFLVENNDPYKTLITAYQENSIIVLDVESTGLDTTKDDIIQIAAIRYGKKGVKEQLDILVKPTRAVGDSFHVHGFTDEQLQAEGLEPQQALELLLEFVKGYVVVGHNVKYDLAIIQSMLYRYQKPNLDYTAVYDTLDLAQKIYPKLPNHKLCTLSELIETKATPNHNALYDILATSEVLTHFIEKLIVKQDIRYEFLEAYDPYVQPIKAQLHEWRQDLNEKPTYEIINYLMNNCHYKEHYNHDEIESIRALYKLAKALYDEALSYEDNRMKLLTFSALHYSEIEQSEFFKDKIPVMTLHQAKGLEFDYVYMAGCNEGLFPSKRSVKEGYLAEEKRLFYVGMTRAKKKLYISYNNSKPMSFFVEDIGENFKTYRQVSEDTL